MAEGMELEIRSIASQQELENAFPVLKELRKELSFADYFSLYEEAQKRDEYQLVGIFDGSECLAVMGYRILFDFAHGKHLYIDDLVVTERERDTGLGARLLEHAEAEARKHNCQGQRLCVRIDNEGAKRFYERNGWSARSIAYKKKG
jgi:ribosomal protein S18 acetylase RimI-like enzyme